MKIVIVLFAFMAVASAYPGIPWAAPVVQPWPSDPWAGAAQPWVAPKVAQPALVKVALPQAHQEVHQVLQVPQQASIPAPHPQPLNIKVHAQTVRIPYHPPHIVKPHLVGFETYVEPVKVVKAPVHHPWD
ncbi:uncharacterized protein LOC117227857 [Megalopta genalis]|uniref:uncharacterized protein LOC117227857 n=1 Tax=Megalopta genalis TaxID=115081 RepID=UPI0014433BFE|nr:uncharacterized protein LOC117227857 [Megalopta genalis]